MFGSLGFNEILFIMVLALLIFGPKRLPQIGRTIGKTMGEFKRATNDLKQSMEVEMTLAEERERAAKTPQPKAASGTEPRRDPNAPEPESPEAESPEPESPQPETPQPESSELPEDPEPDYGVPQREEPVQEDSEREEPEPEPERPVEDSASTKSPEGS